MTLADVIALTSLLVGPAHPQEREAFARAIVSATDSSTERALLTVIARRENWFHLTSYPPFGVTHYVAHVPGVCRSRQSRQERGCTPVTIEHGARLALRFLRHHHRVCRSWLGALGRYRTGSCAGDSVARAQLANARAAVARAGETWSAR